MPADAFSLSQIGQVHIAVQDVDRAAAFYRDVLGMQFLFKFPGMAFFDCAGVRLFLSLAEKPEFDRTSTLYYRVPSIQEAYSALRGRGVAFVDEPHIVHQDARQELWMAFFRDSENNMLAIMSEVPKEQG